ncbi:hypothetical protein LCGC14_2549500, partial [marine sediment metagenome]
DVGLEQDREGNLIEAPEDRFLVVGEDIPQQSLNWEGIITIEPLSIIGNKWFFDKRINQFIFK